MEAVTLKVRRQIEELERMTSSVSTSLLVDGVPVEIFVTRYLIFHLFKHVCSLMNLLCICDHSIYSSLLGCFGVQV